MIYSKWMSYIKDDVKITKLIIPGAHNAGTVGMNGMGCCQCDDLYTQFKYGIRHFCIRLDTKKDGTVVLAHGVSKGMPFEEALHQMKKMIEKNTSEFFIFDIREYYNQKFGPITIKYKGNPEKIDELLEKYIQPSKYAFTEFDNIGDVTMGDIRKSGKRYIIINSAKSYKYSSDAPCILPWDKEVFGMEATEFVKGTLRIFDENSTDGFYWFQTQQTPNPGTQMGIRSPRWLDMSLRPFYKQIIEGIALSPERLEKANIIAGDFMTYDYMKVRDILRLNIIKGNVKEELESEYESGLYR